MPAAKPALHTSRQQRQLLSRQRQPLAQPDSVLTCSECWSCDSDIALKCINTENAQLLSDIDLICRKYHDQLSTRLDNFRTWQDRIISHLDCLEKRPRVDAEDGLTGSPQESAMRVKFCQESPAGGTASYVATGKEANIKLQDSSGGCLSMPSSPRDSRRLSLSSAASSVRSAKDSTSSEEGMEKIEPVPAPVRRVSDGAKSVGACSSVGATSVGSFDHFGNIDLNDIARMNPNTRPSAALSEGLPEWFIGRAAHPGMLDSKHMLHSFRSAIQFEEKAKSGVAISSIGRFRLTWDWLWCIALAYDIWFFSFQFVFAADGDAPDHFQLVSTITRVFFCFDIVLNFFTGFFKGRVECFDVRYTALNYLKCWFWFDIAATLPWEYLSGAGRSAASNIRLAKIPKVAKLLKLATLNRLLKAAAERGNPRSGSMHTMKMMSQNSKSLKSSDGRWSRWTTGPKKVLNAFLLFCRHWKIFMIVHFAALVAFLSHWNGTLFALLHSHKSGLTESSEIIDWYVESVWWAFCELMLGNTSVQARPPPSVWILEFIIFFQRFMIGLHLGLYVVITAMMESEDDARLSVKYEHAMKYLKKRRVSAGTRAQLADCFNETSKQRKMQQSFAELMHNDVPMEMQRRIHQELWSDSLLTFGLILKMSQIHPDFIHMLAQQVQEQVYACHAMVCKEGEPSTCAYYILEGEVIVLNMNMFNETIAPFTKGMWCGEKALVNPQLRRSGTLGTKSITTFLVVAADHYFDLIQHLGLQDDFMSYCTEELWKGMCGRCGSIGYHWAHECPLANQCFNFWSGSVSGRGGSKDLYMKKNPQRSIEWTISGDLRAFMGHYNLGGECVTVFEELNVCTLQGLEEKCALVRDRLSTIDNLELSSTQLKAISQQTIHKFKKGMSNKIRALISADTSSTQHYIFLSHYKVEAGTEAALMRAELQQIFEEEVNHAAQSFDVPIYLDSENLTDLRQLMEAVGRSHNMVLMCTKGVLTRPWCLVEVATAVQKKIPVIPVNIMKNTCEFEFPDENFYRDLVNGTLLGKEGIELIQNHGFEMEVVRNALQQVFMHIACPYSPHRPAAVRMAELRALMVRCQLRQQQNANALTRGPGRISGFSSF